MSAATYDAFAQAITNAYHQYLGRDPEAGIIDQRHQWGATGQRSDAQQIQDIANSDEAKAYAAKKAQQPQQAAGPAPVDPEAQRRQQLESEVSGLFGQYGQLYDQMQSPVDVYNKTMESLGLSDARTRVTNLREQLMNTENLLRNVDSNVTGRTKDSNVTESQRQRLVATEQQPLAGQVQIFGDALNGAMANYGMIQGEGQTQAQLTFQGDQEKRKVLMDRLEVAISRSDSAEDKRRWEAELQRAKDQDAEATRQFNAKLQQDQAQFQSNMSLEQQKLADSRVGGSGGGGGGGSSSSSSNPVSIFTTAFKNWMAGNKSMASRQAQDAYINSLFSQYGVTDKAARQVVWDSINAEFKRNPDPTKDFYYAK